MAQLKNYLGVVRDHTGSMNSIARSAAKDYNQMISDFKSASISQGIDTVAYIMQCGIGRPAKNVFASQNSSISVLQPIPEHSYATTGDSTPLFDAVFATIVALQKVPDYLDPMVSFLIMVTTDGGDNSSRMSGHSLGEEIKKLQQTDRWTFVFRVPRGAAVNLQRMGIPAANILEWDQTQCGVEAATLSTSAGVSSYYAARSAGKTSVSSFYTDLSSVTAKDVNKVLDNISAEVVVYEVATRDGGVQIRDFINARGHTFMLGKAFYELTKREKAIQDHKKILIQNKTSGNIYAGDQARQILGLPDRGSVAVNPGDHGNFNIFVQSTSVNRKLLSGTKVIYWEGA